MSELHKVALGGARLIAGPVVTDHGRGTTLPAETRDTKYLIDAASSGWAPCGEDYASALGVVAWIDIEVIVHAIRRESGAVHLVVGFWLVCVRRDVTPKEREKR